MHKNIKKICHCIRFVQIFEKVLVQNIQFGLSPALTSALHSIPRWQVIHAVLI